MTARHEVTTTAPLGASPSDAPPSAEAAPVVAGQQERLPAGAIRFSDGQVAVMKRTNGLHDIRVGQFLTRIGWSAQVLGQESYGYCRAILALESLGGVPFKVPTRDKELEHYLLNIDTQDLVDLTVLFARYNLGVDVGEASTFSGGEPDA